MRATRVASASELVRERGFADEPHRRVVLDKIRCRLKVPGAEGRVHWHYHPHLVGVVITGWVTVPKAPKA